MGSEANREPPTSRTGPENATGADFNPTLPASQAGASGSLSPLQDGALRIRCPHCRNPIEVLEVSATESIACSSCGKNFTLAGDAPTLDSTASGAEPAKPRKLAHLELMEQVGQGAFGSVWKARDTQLDRIVAVKIPRRGQLGPADMQKFLREARAAAQLRHPNIVSVHEVGVEGEIVYIVSDFVDGATLAQWMQANRPAPRQAAALCKKIAEALHYAHSLGVVHRDLKPGNIMMDLAGEPHIMDFGLAKRQAGEITMTVEGQIMGTPAYMSPEQAQGLGHAVDGRSDVYSLGVVLYEMLTGERPFRGETMMLLSQVIQDEAPSVRKFDARLSRDLETICAKCLAKPPAGRYATAADLADDLGHYLADEPIHARPVGRLERTWRWCKRQPVVASLAAGVVLALLAGTAVSTYFAITATTEKNRADQKAVEAQANARTAEDQKVRAEAELLRSRQLNYYAQINIAQRHILDGNYKPAYDTLWSCPKEFRGWEHDYLWSCLVRRKVMPAGHTDFILSLSFSPDGKRVVTCGRDGMLKVWDAATGQVLLSIGRNSSYSNAIFSPDGKQIVADYDGMIVKVWDSATGKAIRTLRGHTGVVRAPAFSPDGRQIAAGSDNGVIKIWDAATGKELQTLCGNTGWVAYLFFSPDGRQLVSADNKATLKVWDLATGREAYAIKMHQLNFKALALTPDGKRIISAGEDKILKIWDAATGQELRSFKWGYDISSVSVSPDGKRLVVGSEGESAIVWDVATEKTVLTIRGASLVKRASYSPDGTRILAMTDNTSGQIWDATTGEPLVTLKGYVAGAARKDQDKTTGEVREGEAAGQNEPILSPENRTLRGHKGVVWSMAFSPDGKRLVSGGADKTAKIWDVATGREIQSLKAAWTSVTSVSFSPDGKRIVGGGTPILIWDAATGQSLVNIKTDYARSVAFSPDGNRILSTGGDRLIQVWDSTTGQELLSTKGGYSCAAYSPDGKRIASCVLENGATKIKVWDAATGEPLLSTPLGGLFGWLVFSPDGARIYASSYDLIQVWNARTGEQELRLLGHNREIPGLAISPDGKRLISAGVDKTIKVWDTATGLEILTLRGHTEAVRRVAFSPDGKRIASCSNDGTIKLWDAPLQFGRWP